MPEKNEGRIAMKKLVFIVMAVVLMVSLSATVMAESFTLPVPCATIKDDQLYNYHVKNYVLKQDDTYNIVWVRHRVSQTDAIETNRIAAYCEETGNTCGANWHRPDYGKYQCMSNAIFEGYHYSVAGRGNINYATKYSLNNITLVGTFDPN